MKIDIPDDLIGFIKEWLDIGYILPEEIPNIELYMDQLTTFMDKQLENNKRYDKDKILTKTMINNYTKNDLLPSSNKKKYSKNHILLLIYIYHFKNILSMNDIYKVLKPMNENFSNKKSSSKNSESKIEFENSMDEIYKTIFELEKKHRVDIEKSVMETIEMSKDIFKSSNKDEEKFLNNFVLIALLGYDIYLKEHIVEKMIDTFYII